MELNVYYCCCCYYYYYYYYIIIIISAHTSIASARERARRPPRTNRSNRYHGRHSGLPRWLLRWLRDLNIVPRPLPRPEGKSFESNKYNMFQISKRHILIYGQTPKPSCLGEWQEDSCLPKGRSEDPMDRDCTGSQND